MKKRDFRLFRYTQLIFRPRCLALALLLLVASTSASARVLVSNINQTTGFASPLSYNDQAQAFTTGSNSEGYYLSSVEVKFQVVPASDITVRVTSNLTDTPTVVATLNHPASFIYGNNMFTAPLGTKLLADTTYYVIVTGETGSLIDTNSILEDADSLSGWSLFNGSHLYSSNNWLSSTNSRMIRINGTENTVGPDLLKVAVTSTPQSGPGARNHKYGAGEKIQFTLTFDESANVTGDPVFEFKMGSSGGTKVTRNAAYVRGSGTSELVFEYTVQSGDRDHDGISVEANALTLDEDDTIRDGDDNNAILVHAALGEQSDHRVNGGLTIVSNNAPTASDGEVVTESDKDYTFTASDFNFSDQDHVDVLASVKIETLPGNGRGKLRLDGTALISSDLPKTVTKNELDKNKLTYDPPTGASGDDYTSFNFKVSDGGDDSATSYTMTIDVIALPNITRVRITSTPQSGPGARDYKYGVGEKIQITVTFDEAVTVTGDPVFEIRMGNASSSAPAKEMAYVSGSSTNALVFEYTVQSGDRDDNGIWIKADALKLDGNDVIQDSDNNNADLKHTALRGQTRHKVDGRLTIVSNNAPTASNGQVTAKEDTGYAFRAWNFNFSDVDSVDRFASVKIVTEETAGDLELNGTDVVANGVVTKAQLDNGNLIFTPATDVYGETYATFTFKVSDGLDESALGYTMTVNVDSVPDITQVAVISTPTSGTTPKKYGVGEKIQIEVTFDEEIYVVGDPVFEIRMGNSDQSAPAKEALYVRRSRTNALLFEYTVQSGDQDNNGIWIKADALKLDGNDVIRDSNSNRADLTHTSLGGRANHKVDGSLVPAPVFSSAEVNGTSLVITFDENLASASSLANSAFTVKKTPEGGSEIPSVTLSGSPVINSDTVTLTLGSPVLATDTDIKVSYTKPGSGSNNKLKDQDGNEVASFTNQTVTNNSLPGFVFTPANLTVNEGSTANYNVKLNVQPAANVTVTITSGDTSAVTLSPTTLTFTPSNWNQAQQVTVTGVLDDDKDNETVTLSHRGSGVVSGNFTVTTSDDNSRFIPLITSSGSFTAAENQLRVTPLTASVNGVATTAGLSWSITGGADASHFSLTISRGVLSFSSPQNFENSGDAGSDGTYELTVQVSKGGYTSLSQNIEVRLQNVNEAPKITTANSSFNVEENQTSTIVTLAATDVDSGDDAASLTWSKQGGADASHFTLTGTGALSFTSPQNFENPSDNGGNRIYEVTVQVSDDEGLTDRQNIQVRLQNVNEAPSITTTAGPFNANENQTSDAIVTLAATDTDSGDTASNFRWSIVDSANGGGADASHFQIVGGNELRFGSAKDYESFDDDGNDGTYNVTVQVSDDEGLTDRQDIQVRLQNVNEAPSITSSAGPFNANENQTSETIVTLVATDTDSGDTASNFRWSIVDSSNRGGADASHFQIVSGNELRFRSAKDYESSDDDGNDGTYNVTVQVRDDEGLTDRQDIQVRLQNVNEAPSITTTAGPFNANENQTSDAIVTLAATDTDSGDTAGSLTWIIVDSSNGGGADASHFEIVGSNELRFSSAKDYESFDDDGSDGTYNVTVQVRDDEGLTDRQNIQVRLQNVNEAPSITTSAGPFNANENQTSDTIVTLTAADTDGGDTASNFRWSIVDSSNGGGADASHFQIVGGNELRFSSAKDYESFDDDGNDGTYNVTVQVSDDEGLTDRQNIQVRLQNVNEAPSIITTAGPFNANENQTSDIIVTLAATDTDSGDDTASFTWSIVASSSGGQADSSHFEILNDNKLHFRSAKDYESFDDDGSDGTYNVTLQVRDDEGLTDRQNIQVRLQNVNEAPSITTDNRFNINEGQTFIGTLAADDPERDTLTWSKQGGNDAGLFTLGATTGALSFTSTQDFENPSDHDNNGTYEITVQVSDNSLSNSQNIQVRLLGVSEDPPIITTLGPFEVDENQTSIVTLEASDADSGGNLLWSIDGGADQEAFSLNSQTGVLTFKVSKNFEAPDDSDGKGTYELKVAVNDGTFNVEADILVSLRNVVEAPVITTVGPLNVDENETAVATLSADDEDTGEVLTWSITGGNDNRHFSLTDKGELTFNDPKDFESLDDADTNGIYEVTAKVSDGTLTTSANLQVRLQGVNEFVPVINTLGPFDVAEDQTAVATLAATHDDDGEPLTWSIVGGPDKSHFSLDKGTGNLAFAGLKDYESPDDTDGDGIYDFTVQVTDGKYGSEAQFLVQLQNVIEGGEPTPDPSAPVVTTLGPFGLLEGDRGPITLLATDLENDTLTWTIVGGEDADLFSITEDGELSFNDPQDFENPNDEGGNRSYIVIVQVSDDSSSSLRLSLSTRVTLLIHLQNVNEAPVIRTRGPLTLEQGETAVATLEATDEDVGGVLFWSLDGGDDAEHFLLTEEGELSFSEVKNLDSPDDADGNGIYEITVRVNDGAHAVTADLEVHLLQAKSISSIAKDSGDSSGGCGRFQPITRSSLIESGVDKGSPLGSGGHLPVSRSPGSGLPSPIPNFGGLLFFLGLMLFPALLVQWLRWSS